MNKHESENGPLMKGINCSGMTIDGKIKKALFRAHVCSLEQRGRDVHDQNGQTIILSNCY